MDHNVIPFDAQNRLLKKAQSYLDDVELLDREGDQAIAVLIKALNIADDDLKLRIVLLLGTLASPQTVWPLYGLMRNINQSDTIRHAAAVQLSVMGGTLENTRQLVSQLIADLHHTDPFVRANAAFAMGWEGNLPAYSPLIRALNDTDAEVQQAAVNALSNLRDDSVFQSLADQLQQGPKEQQRSILYNLWRFPSRKQQTIGIYTRFLQHTDADLRYDALALLDAVGEPQAHLSHYLQCLKDPEAKIRELALVRLVSIDKGLLNKLAPHVRILAHDPAPKPRQAAIRLLHHICPTPVAALSATQSAVEPTMESSIESTIESNR